MRPHEDLDVWKRAVELVVSVYAETKEFPSDERFGLTSQIRRAAVSIPANIAEGAARKSDKENLQFLSIAQGSCSELETELLIASKLGYLETGAFESLRNESSNIGRMLIGLSRYLESKSK
jgi:four helix bundle protein